MGWDVDIRTYKDVTEAVVDDIVQEIIASGDREMIGFFGGSKQEWGWSLGVDLSLVSPRKLHCSGSCSISGRYAERWCDDFILMLNERGIKAKLGKFGV
jgi:hypothetical protein